MPCPGAGAVSAGRPWVSDHPQQVGIAAIIGQVLGHHVPEAGGSPVPRPEARQGGVAEPAGTKPPHPPQPPTSFWSTPRAPNLVTDVTRPKIEGPSRALTG